MSAPAVRIAHPHVAIEEGRPIVRGSQVPVRALWNLHRVGFFVADLFDRYPCLSRAAILDALSFAYDNQDLMDADEPWQ